MMNQRKLNRRLTFESLEAKELLSVAGVTGLDRPTMHHVVQAHRAARMPVADVALNLSGLMKGNFRATGGGSTAHFTGRGTVCPVGKAQLQGTIVLGSSTASGQLTLKFGRKGAIIAAITGKTPTG